MNAPSATLVSPPPALTSAGPFAFSLATVADDAELREFGRTATLSGPILARFERGPDYFAALGVEGRQQEVLICRERPSGRIVAVGHRSIKAAYVNGELSSLAYLGGLHVAPSVRSARLLQQGYAQLRRLQASRPAPFHLSTIMEDNRRAREVLLSGRLGLPAYRDLGRFCCIAARVQPVRADCAVRSIAVRRASVADGPAVVAFLQREGRSRQFFPHYALEDFGRADGLLAGLRWEDVFLAWRGSEILGVLAAWDQRALRRWQITGYGGWLARLRRPLNALAWTRRLPRLPPAGSPLAYVVLALLCVRDGDAALFRALLREALPAQRSRAEFFLAGLHERDPLAASLLDRPHLAFHSRVCLVGWPDEDNPVGALDPARVPYLEMGAL